MHRILPQPVLDNLTSNDHDPPMPAGVLTIEIRIPLAESLKDKRQLLRHLLGTARARYQVAAAEVDLQDLHQHALLSFAAVGASVTHVAEILDTVERFVWSDPRVTVLSSARHWLDLDP